MPNVTITVIKNEDGVQCHYLLDIKERVAISDVASLVKVIPPRSSPCSPCSRSSPSSPSSPLLLFPLATLFSFSCCSSVHYFSWDKFTRAKTPQYLCRL
jgi:hypothetical protein